uniref:SGNH hydrolase-type esterase domain-containing protein n=1 Tax=Magallana gigas TaxID=29159 RepID=A0A8W8LX68_MAGGI
MSILNVCVIGHSYIRRLRDYGMQTETDNLNLDPEVFKVSFRGKGGLRLSKRVFRSEILHFDSIPDVVFLQIGENDICENTNSEKLARDIISVGQYLRDGVGVKTNEHLKRFAEPLGGIYFWGHRGFWKDFHYLGPDGVHLLCTPAEDQPMRKFRRSIRNAVILHSKVLRPV